MCEPIGPRAVTHLLTQQGGATRRRRHKGDAHPSHHMFRCYSLIWFELVLSFCEEDIKAAAARGKRSKLVWRDFCVLFAG